MIKAPDKAFRAHNPLWSGSPISGVGAARNGGRFNPKGVETLYLSRDYQTAVLEAAQGFPEKMQPLTITQYDVDCSDIIDLTKVGERRRWKVDATDLGCAWKDLATQKKPVPSWEIVDRLKAEGAAGILVRSFAPGARPQNINLVLWKWGAALPHRVMVVDDDGRLPPARPPSSRPASRKPR